MPTTGHNGSDVDLKRLVERIEKLEDEKREMAADIKAIYDEAKRSGFDTKIIRMLIRERQVDAAELAEREAILDTYRKALGMLATTPLGEAAIGAAA